MGTRTRDANGGEDGIAEDLDGRSSYSSTRNNHSNTRSRQSSSSSSYSSTRSNHNSTPSRHSNSSSINRNRIHIGSSNHSSSNNMRSRSSGNLDGAGPTTVAVVNFGWQGRGRGGAVLLGHNRRTPPCLVAEDATPVIRLVIVIKSVQRTSSTGRMTVVLVALTLLWRRSFRVMRMSTLR